MKLLGLPLLLLFGSASAQTYGDWMVSKELPEFQIAKTFSGTNTAGIACSIKTSVCSAYIALDAPCEAGAVTIMLINSAVGAMAVHSTCTLIGDAKFGFFTEFNDVVSAFESGGDVGFALALRSGQYRVVRFSTRGATAAIREAMTKPAPPPPAKNDYRL